MENDKDFNKSYLKFLENKEYLLDVEGEINDEYNVKTAFESTFVEENHMRTLKRSDSTSSMQASCSSQRERINDFTSGYESLSSTEQYDHSETMWVDHISTGDEVTKCSSLMLMLASSDSSLEPPVAETRQNYQFLRSDSSSLADNNYTQDWVESQNQAGGQLIKAKVDSGVSTTKQIRQPISVPSFSDEFHSFMNQAPVLRGFGSEDSSIFNLDCLTGGFLF